MALIKNSHAAGKTLVWTVPQPKVRIEGKVAWITYLNRGSMQDAAGHTPRGKIGIICQAKKATYRPLVHREHLLAACSITRNIFLTNIR